MRKNWYLLAKKNINEVRRELRALGYKVKIQGMSWGSHASFFDLEGNEQPSMYFHNEGIEKWKPLIDYLDDIKKRQIDVVDSDGTSIYGFGKKRNR